MKLMSVKVTDEQYEKVKELGGLTSLLRGKLENTDIAIVLKSINHQLTELNQRMSKLEVGIPAPKVELGGMESLKKYCSNCNQPKGIIGGARDNSGKWVCVDCVKKLTPQEQML